MKINVKVKPNSKQEKVERISPSDFSVWVKAPAKEGKANDAVLELLSRYLAIPQSKLIILRGHRFKDKVIQVAD